MKTACFLLLLFSCPFLFAQGEKKKVFPTAAIGLQYAGSIGWLSAGYYRQSANEKSELGALYGYTPEFAGGRIHSFALKFMYQPFRVNFKRGLQIEPLQTGVFVSQTFGKNLYLFWPDKYTRKYYWWTNSTRFHLFLSTQASYTLNWKDLKKISFYFETNTNDLYLFSYAGNRNWKSIHLSEIFFFGIGSKVYFK